MGLDLFRVVGNIDLQNNALDSNAHVMQGSGAPGGTTETNAAPIGSVWMRTDGTGDKQNLYYKWSLANNSTADWKVVVDKEYVDALATGLSWREPALVLDDTTYANIAAAETDLNTGSPPGIVDGIGVSDGDRILYTDLTTGNDNVYIVTGTPGSGATLVEDTNLATDGDAILIQDGSFKETQWVFDGANWVLFGSSGDSAELGYIRNFIGKTGPGSELPSYTSTNVITASSNLEVALGEVDAAFGDGSITNTTASYIINDQMDWNGGALDLTDVINLVNDGIGDRLYSAENYITDGESITDSLEALDIAVGALAPPVDITGTQAAGVLTTMDTIAVATATEVKWMIQAYQTGTTANRRAVEVHAFTDGTAIDHTEYAVLKLGNNINGFDVDVAISGTDIILTIDSTPGTTYTVKRISTSLLT